MKRIYLSFFAAFCLAASWAVAEPTATPTPTFNEKDYFMSQSFTLHPTPDGIEGKLELWQDKALKKRKQYAHEEAEDLSYNTTSEEVFKNAYLFVKSRGGTVVDSMELFPWATVEKRNNMDGTGCSIFLVTTDYDNGNPYLIGPYTSLIAVRNSGCVTLRYKDGLTGKKDEISLSHCRRGYWKLVPSPTGKGKEIWNLWCDNYIDPKPPNTHYQRYDFDGQDWVMRETKVHKFFDWYVDDLPPDSVFRNAGK
jgi:hypothetical protein